MMYRVPQRPQPRFLRLGVNIDHVATLRNARGGAQPDPLAAAQAALAAGADSITLHLREDRRHIRDHDLQRIRSTVAAPINLEMAATAEMLAIALAMKPHACCIVPERRQEITTEGGLDAAHQQGTLQPVVDALRQAGIRVSLFIDPDPHQLHAAQRLGAPVVELHTGRYAEQAACGAEADELARLQRAARLATTLELECHAGHGLTLCNVPAIAMIPDLSELNIGHFIIAQAVFDGLASTVSAMRRAMNQARAHCDDTTAML